MGRYINIGNKGFQSALNGEYIDKSGLISVVNHTLFTEQRFSCVTRSRRFGKSMAAKMLCAYYDQSCHSQSLFDGLAISHSPEYKTHLNRYPVIYLDMTPFVARSNGVSIVEKIDTQIKEEILQLYPKCQSKPDEDLMDCLTSINVATGVQFIFIIDEWDAICREFSNSSKEMDNYVNWLRKLFKDVHSYSVFAGVYMTGILPIKKYDTQSALNNFVEYSMVEPMDMPQYFGFTHNEVLELSERYSMDYNDLEKWYDGYQIGDEKSIFNPNSVMMALKSRRCRSYWSGTGAFEAIASYIMLNFDGLKDNIIYLLGGGRVKVNTTKFQNDMSVIASKDDVLTVLIHLGNLSYDWHTEECYVPNYEVAGELKNAVEKTDWSVVIDALEQSERLLAATIRGDENAVANGVSAIHDESTSILSYNDENSLACVLSIAYYYARNNYIIHRELASGKGYADLVLIPRKNVNSPAIIIEMKYGKTAEEAISQIKRRDYISKVTNFTHDILFVGINYDRDTKEHQCRIERQT